MKYRLGVYSVTTEDYGDKLIYIAKGVDNAVLFVVRESVTDQVLGLYLDGYSNGKLSMLLKGLR